jgi:SpoU rRNA methylase family enzyme
LSSRRSSIPTRRAIANEAPKALELETRVGRLEVLLKDIRDAIEVLKSRTVAIQAQLDHLDARVGRR